MLRKILSVKNIGRFRSSAATGNAELSRQTLIVGANGLGKTTLCAIFRSLKTGDSTIIAGRRRLGVEEPPIVKLLFSSGQKCFDGTSWSAIHSPLAIFDGVFVADNVHAGEVVEIDQKRNLYHVIIGEEGVRLAEEDTRLARQSREKTGEISALAKAIQPHIPTDMTFDTFLGLQADPEIDARIAEQERTIAAVRQARQINDRALLSAIEIPNLPNEFAVLLARTLDDVAQDAESRLAEHLVAHDMEADVGNWIAEGLEHADSETCPFCGQDIRGLPLIAAYRGVFSDRYTALRKEITAMRNQIADQFGEGKIGRLNTLAEQNKGTVEFWSRFCAFDPASTIVVADILDAIRALGQAAVALLDRKGQAPLERIQLDSAFNTAVTTYVDAQAKARAINDAILAINAIIAAKKHETAAANVQTAQAELARRQASKARHTDPVSPLCGDHERLLRDKASIDHRKLEVRRKLDVHTRMVVKPYEQLINQYLDAFNAGFNIAEIKHSYPSGVAASTYQLVVNNIAIDVGDGHTPPNRPSFKNTLSSGDRTTLALAFFLTHLWQDKTLSTKTVIFDDPFNSQDSFRRRQTVHEITKVRQRCCQVIVFSHDATFLKQIWDKTPAAERVALTLADHRAQGTKIMPVDLERACQGRTAADVDDLLTYLNTGAGAPLDLIRKMRAVLETYCWTTYPASFQAGQDWLGEIVRKIREGGEAHPAGDLYDELDQINDYTSGHHHGEDVANATPDEIDPRELTGYVKRTLSVVNAIQA